MARNEHAARVAASTTVSELREKLSERLNRVSYRNESTVVERRGGPLAALVS